jgi:hypothetical protein
MKHEQYILTCLLFILIFGITVTLMNKKQITAGNSITFPTQAVTKPTDNTSIISLPTIITPTISQPTLIPTIKE